MTEIQNVHSYFLLKLAQIFCKMLELNSRQVLLVQPIKFFSQANAMQCITISMNRWIVTFYIFERHCFHTFCEWFSTDLEVHTVLQTICFFLFIFFLFIVSKNVSVDFFFIFPTSSIFTKQQHRIGIFPKISNYSNVYIRRVYVRFIAR